MFCGRILSGVASPHAGPLIRPPKRSPLSIMRGRFLDSAFRVRILSGVASPHAGTLIRPPSRYSHSIVAGGLPEMSYTTRLMPRTSLMMRLETLPNNACGNGAQCAVMKSCVCTARNATTHS
jgi:hypothetical protein